MATAATQFGSRTLQQGMRGADVKTLQHDLTVVGIATRVTGVFNHPTESSVVSFQQRNHLSADGVVGPQTASKLKTIARQDVHNATATPAAQSNNAQGNDNAQASSASGGTSMTPPPSDAPVEKATLNSQGLAVAPSDAPQVVREVIDAANNIAFDPYVYGGGHQSFQSSGYDCSGSVSYALHGGGLLSSPEDSSQFETYGVAGAGRWITIYANGGHAYMNVAGLWFDTAAQSSSNNNDRWSATRVSSASGFIVRHPANW